MISIIGLRGDNFSYKQEEYNYNPKKEVIGTYRSTYSGMLCTASMPLEESILDKSLVMEKGAQWMFSGTGLALSELLVTLQSK